MDNLTKEKKEEIVKKLSEKGVTNVLCPMCKNNHFVVAEGYFNTTLQNSLESFSLGGRSIPTIPIICSKCGFVSQHALGVLGLLPEIKEEKEK